MKNKNRVVEELAGVYESLLCDLHFRVKEKIIALKEIVELYEAIDKLEERLDELTCSEDDV